VDRMFQHSQHFFDLSDEIKRSVEWSANNRGYVPIERERLDSSKAGDLKEAFNVMADANKWPEVQSMTQFRVDTQRFFNMCFDASLYILSVYALALGLHENFFEDSLKKEEASGTTLRFLHYPAVPKEREMLPGQLRAGAHSDYGSITLLFQNLVGGLEVLSKSSNFVPVAPIKGAIVVNTGDLMQRWTADQFCSTVHRVNVNSGAETSRYSIAFFVHPNDSYEVRSFKQEMSEKYPPITAGQYLKQRLDATY